MTTKLNETKTNQPVKKLVKLIRNELLLKLNYIIIIFNNTKRFNVSKTNKQSYSYINTFKYLILERTR